MAVFVRPDSKYFWLYLERPDKKGIKERTSVLALPENRKLAERVYHERMRALAETLHFAPRRLKPPRRDASGLTYIYFVSDGEFIKIGRAVDVLKRIRSLQSGHPRQLTVLTTMLTSLETERLLHRRFDPLRAKARASGEWFRPEGDLMAFIERLRLGENVHAELIEHFRSVPGIFAQARNYPKLPMKSRAK